MPDTTKDAVLTVRISRKVMRDLKRRAEQDRRSVASTARLILEHELAKAPASEAAAS
jgi:hypothetical protein